MSTVKTTDSKGVGLTNSEIVDMVPIFKALADASRLQILAALAEEDDLCVSGIADRLGMSISRVSHHLTLLEHLGFVKGKQDGKQVYHYVDDDCIIDIMRRAREHVAGN